MTGPLSPPVDNSGAAERTLLAWRRTALMVGVASVITARVLAQDVGPLAFAIGLIGIGLAIAAYGPANLRYNRGRPLDALEGPAPTASTRRLASLALAAAVVAALGLAVIVTIN